MVLIQNRSSESQYKDSLSLWFSPKSWYVIGITTLIPVGLVFWYHYWYCVLIPVTFASYGSCIDCQICPNLHKFDPHCSCKMQEFLWVQRVMRDSSCQVKRLEMFLRNISCPLCFEVGSLHAPNELWSNVPYLYWDIVERLGWALDEIAACKYHSAPCNQVWLRA